MNKILCPVDFSETSLNAIEYAVEVARKFHSHITLLHVFTESDFNKIVGSESIGLSFKELLGMAKKKLVNITDEINANTKEISRCDFKVELGDLVDKIQDTVKDGDYDLLVMGTTGVSRVKGVFFGSNTESVIDKLKVPILCVPTNARYSDIKRIVYASDFMKEDRMAIQEVISFATVFNARIYVLHINLGEDTREYDQFIKELKSFVQYNKISFVNKNYKENIGLSIEEYMNEEESDMLVVYKRQRSFVESIFHKSLTKILSYSTDKPLFVLKLEAQ